MCSSACASTALQSRDRKWRRPLGCGDRFSEVACDLLAGGHAVRFSAPGWSMGPTIRDGETVLVEPVQVSQVRRGDILLYRWERGLRAHRVARIVAQASAGTGAAPVFILRGDAGGEDELVRVDEIVGRVVSLERNDRRIRLRGPVAMGRRALRQGASRIRRWVRGACPEGNRPCATGDTAALLTFTGSIGTPVGICTAGYEEENREAPIEILSLSSHVVSPPGACYESKPNS